MKKLFCFAVFLSLFFSVAHFSPTQVYAVDGCTISITGNGGTYPANVTVSSGDVQIDGPSDDTWLEISIDVAVGQPAATFVDLDASVKSTRTFGPIDITEQLKDQFSKSGLGDGGVHRYFVSLHSKAGLGTYKICQNELQYTTSTFQSSEEACSMTGIVCKDKNNQFRVSFSGSYSGFKPGQQYFVKEDVGVGVVGYDTIPFTASGNGSGAFQVGKYLQESVYTNGYSINYCTTGVYYETDACAYAPKNCTVHLGFDPNVKSCDDVPDFPDVPATSSGTVNHPFYLCQQAGAAQQSDGSECMTCLQNDGIWTAVGCIPYKDTTGMIRAFINLALGIGGGVVVLMVLGGGFLLSTSQGDPKRVEEAKAMISSSIMGLVFIIFSITILRFIGVSVLQLPGFGN